KPLTADGEAFVDVGSIDPTTKTGTMQNILAPVSITSPVVVELDDSNDPTGRNVTVNVVNEVVQVTNMAPAPISINVFGPGIFGAFALHIFQLFGGRGRNTFNVLDTPNAFRFGQQETATAIFTGTGGDTVNVRGTSSEELNIIGGSRQPAHDLVTIGNNG